MILQPGQPVKLISITGVDDAFKREAVHQYPDLEASLDNPDFLAVFIARVSSSNQGNPDHKKLLRYLISNRHWSPFEHVHITFEIASSRAIAAQILRHRSFTFQELSQRYAEVSDFYLSDCPRAQGKKNRQGSSEEKVSDQNWWVDLQKKVYQACEDGYREALDKGVCREQARFMLPLATMTRLYMTGPLRSWIHYLTLRVDAHSQEEHREIAVQIAANLEERFPTTFEALRHLGKTHPDYEVFCTGFAGEPVA